MTSEAQLATGTVARAESLPSRAWSSIGWRSAGPAIFLALLFVLFSTTTANFFRLSNVRSIAFVAAILVIATVAQTMVVITRNLDLSLGAVMAMSAYLPLLLYRSHPGLGGWVVPCAILVGVALGAINGFVVGFIGIPSIIATLGTLSVFRGLIYAADNGSQISVGDLPKWLPDFVGRKVLGIPDIAIVALAVAIVAAVTLRRTVFGRCLYAVGSSARASEFYGLPVRWTVLRAYAAAGGLAGVAGLLLAGRAGTVTVDMASGWELQTLAAAVIGGASLLGGTGGAAGAVMGALVIATIDNGLVQMGISGYWQGFVQGAAIVIAVGFDVLLQRHLLNRLTRPKV